MSPAFSRNTFLRPHINLGYGNDMPNGVNTLPELIEFAAKHNPNHIFGLQARSSADVGPGSGASSQSGDLSLCEITFAQLQHAVERASVWLVSSGATPGRTRRTDKVAPVAIFLGSDITIFMYMAALLRIGTPVLVLSARLSAPSVVHLLKETRATAVLTSRQLVRTTEEARALLSSDPEGCNTSFIHAPNYFDFEREPGNAIIPPVYREHRYGDLDAILLHTSGTTGLPKLVYHAQAYILLYATCHRLPPQKDPFQFNVSTLPLYHGFGLLAPCLSLSIGMPFVLLPPSMIPTGQCTLMALQSTGARYMLTVPSIVEDILRLPEVDGLAVLRQLEILAIGGAPMKESIAQELVQSNIKILNHWGTTELGAIAPIERPPPGYDRRYLMPRTDLNLKFIPLGDGSDTFRLIGQAPGWKEPNVVQDLLIINPHDTKQFRILARADDLLVLATGEKVRPAALEREVASHPSVKEVLAFGDGKLELGLIIELMKGSILPHANLDNREETLLVIAELGLDAYIQRGNDYVEGHGKIAKEMVVLTREDDKPLKRTDKGSVPRKENYVLFEKEIRKCYERMEIARSYPIPMPRLEGGMALRRAIRDLVKGVDIGLEGDISDDLDFFEAGMDSLQASRLRRAILSRLRATNGIKFDDRLTSNFIFVNSSVNKLFSAISSILNGYHLSDPALVVIREERRIALMAEMLEKYKRVLASFQNLVVQSKKLEPFRDVRSKKKVALLTGSTGSLGCFLLAGLVKDPTVSRVVCLNRPGAKDLKTRQTEQMQRRRIDLSTREWAKVILCDCDLTKDNLALGRTLARHLSEVTHIVHNAWPVNFNRTLSSFEPHIKGLVNLVRIALLSANGRTGAKPVRLLFASSIAVVGRYPLINPNGPSKVPECVLGPENVAKFGYAEAKWVCERLLMTAMRMYGSYLRTSCVRIGQMTGPEGSGVWNENEHFPILVRTSCVLRALPLLQGSLSWLPVDRAAYSIIDLLVSQSFVPVYHVENPTRQSWTELIQMVAEILRESTQVSELEMVKYDQWLARVRGLGSDTRRNPAYPLIPFLEKDFLRLATGGVVLDTTMSVRDSVTMASSVALERRYLEQYVTYWQAVGAI
ncbi:hypothetical protein AX17_006652 [Amanita inopinata Kibby_2008]|nr:hypothetical protein AX17_006652 [Amanita inopinata Kibby_2008]